MAEAGAVLRRSEDVIIVAWRRRRGWEAGKGINEGWNIAIILPRRVPRVDRPDADDNDRYHPPLTIFLAVVAVGTGGTPAATSSGACPIVRIAAKPEHPEEVERLLIASDTVSAVCALVVPQG